MDGRIERIVLTNFMTYTHVEVLPGPHLNIVIGPNGTGKSSIVCAILLGLKTKPKVLGRGGNLTSFVKTSCSSATIEIELLNLQGKNYIIKRVIIAKDGSSKWLLNGDEKSSKEIEDLATKLKLQVDNLCQFLPQDRVQDFARMDHHELLINTIKCVGSDGMLEDLEQLKKFRKMELELLGDVQQLKERLGREQQLIARIQGEVDSLNQRESMEKDLTSYKQKHAWLLYAWKRGELKQKVKEALQHKKQHETRIAPFEKAAQTDEQNLRRLQEQLNQEFRLVEGKRQEMDRKVRDVQLNEGLLEDEKRRLNTKLKEREKLLNVITDLERGLEMLRDNLAHLQQKQEINPAELENLKAKEIEYKQVKSSHMSNVSRLKIKKMDLKHDIPEIGEDIPWRRSGENHVQYSMAAGPFVERFFLSGTEMRTTPNTPWPPVPLWGALENRRLKFSDVSDQRLRKLCDPSSTNDVYKAVMSLRQNKGLFQGRVYEPIMMLINVKKSQNAIYLENVISYRDLIAFVFENADDMNLFLTKVRAEQHLCVNAIQSSCEEKVFKPEIPLDKLKPLGFHSYLSDLFTAPPAIYNYICEHYNAHKIPIGNEKAESQEVLPKEIRTFLSTDKRQDRSISKYSGEMLCRQDNLRPAKLLNISVDEEELARIDSRILEMKQALQNTDEELEQIETEVAQVDKKLEKIIQKRHELEGHEQKINRLNNRICAKEDDIRRCRRELESEEQIKESYNKNVNTLIVQLTNCQNKRFLVLGELLRMYKDYKLLKFETEGARYKCYKTTNKVEEMRKKINAFQILLDTAERDLASMKTNLRELLEAAKASTDGFTPANPEFERYSALFETLPNDVVDLKSAIRETRAKLSCLGDVNPHLIQEYEQRSQQIADLNGALEGRANKNGTLMEKMHEIKGRWLPPLRELVERINSKFGECFNALKSAGEVVLDYGQDENDFEHYGLRIRVKFRSEDQLQNLNRRLQSGGERSVSTAIFMISLQGLSRVPFCCVDEINQGMDKENERLIINLLSATTNQANSAQYFLITPKILPKLEYSRNTRVLCVNNGCHLQKNLVLNLQKVLKGR
uniref:Structural maintenance of chromosomes protein 5 n=1 Tax=Timema douglasi TaxID=61478 RepID=A0A7R8VQE6_TIMDO|nr:unnamed protein product [Timema douglasi]